MADHLFRSLSDLVVEDLALAPTTPHQPEPTLPICRRHLSAINPSAEEQQKLQAI
jgi:hypothetical protein